MGIRDRLRKLEGGRGKDSAGDPVRAWRERFGEDPPEPLKRLFSIPIRAGTPVRGFTREELDEADVDLADVLRALAVAGGMGTPDEAAASAARGSGDGHYPADPGKNAVSGPSAGPLAEDGEDARPDEPGSPLRRRPREL